MIRIKVCKLSDLMNRAMILLISGICLLGIFQLTVNVMNKTINYVIPLSLKWNLCAQEENSFMEEMLFRNLPISSSKWKDDIENEFQIVDNKNGDEVKTTELKSDSNSVSNEQINQNVESTSIQNKVKLNSPYLLNCKQLPNGKYQIGSVIINDYTKKKLDYDELEKSLFTKVENDCRVLLYHTHTSESYIGTQKGTDAYRTDDENSNVVGVGNALQQELNKYGIFVRHDTTQHDYPSYNGAYKSSLNTVENILKNENYDIIIDIHRDALSSNAQYRPTAEINGETVAKLMFVIGTNTAGLKHDHWIENLKFAVAFQQRANELFPGLFRDLHLSTSRYNQHTSNKTIIMEVGATGNTIEEACLAMKYFAMVLDAMRSQT